jgi:putative ABC transport system substrate-binding protein
VDRRTLIGAGITVVAAPLVSTPQAATAVRRIGVLFPGVQRSEADIRSEGGPLRALGWVEGQNLLVERRYAGGRAELLQPLAEELVRLRVEIIATWGTPATLAAKNATTTIPIVIHSAADPVRSGLVATLARPGGNITGFSVVSTELDAKRLTVLRELLPRLQRVGVLEDAVNPHFRTARSEFEQACRSLGMQPIFMEVAAAGELEDAIAQMARRGAQALFVHASDLFYDSRVVLASIAMKYRLPTLAAEREILEAGALVSYVPNLAEMEQRHAAFIDRILRGAKPADLPIEQPTQFDLVINLRSARALRIVVPQTLLHRAAEVIQ